MRRFSSLSLAALAALSLIACETGLEPLPDPVPPEVRPDILPLAVGNEWVLAYRDSSYISGVVREGLDTLRVIDAYTLDGETWSIIEASGQSSLRSLFDGHYTNREDGVWEWDIGTENLGVPYLIYKVPVEAGETYQVPSGESSAMVTVEDVSTEIEVGAGMFDSIQYVFDYDEAYPAPTAPGAAHFRRALARGIGFIRLDAGYLTYGEGGSLVRASTIEWTLVSFSE